MPKRRVARAAAPVSLDDDPVAVGLLAQEFLTCRQRDPFDLLGVPVAWDSAVLQKAFLKKADALMTNLVAIIGWGEYFPWAVPGLFAQGKSPLPSISYWIVLFTGLAGMVVTYFCWMLSDQSR